MTVPITSRMIATAGELWAQGATIADIAEQLCVNKYTLATYIRNNHDIFPNRRYHMDVWMARLTECKGMSAVAIAVKYGVSKSTVFKWAKIIRESEVERVGS